MKKKYRRAVFVGLITIIAIALSPIALLGVIGTASSFLCETLLIKPIEWLEDKLRVYDTDQN